MTEMAAVPPALDARSPEVVVAGDLHGNLGWAVDVVERAAYRDAHLILQVGDFGALWPGDGGQFERRLNNRLARRDMLLIFIAGNHDNWAELPRLPLNDAGFGVLAERIWWAPQGHRFVINERVFGVLGGAYSPDKDLRTPGVDWWPEEEPTQEEVDRLGDERLDILLTHDAPPGAPLRSTLTLPPDHTAERPRELIDQAVVRTRPEMLIHGHWHQRQSYSIRRAHGRTDVEALGCDEDMTEGDAIVLEPLSLHCRPLQRRKQD